jgi:hypothetical protein
VGPVLTSVVEVHVCGLLVGQQTGDAWALSLMCSRRPTWRAIARQFFRWAMPGSTRMRREECALRLRSCISSYQSGALFLNCRCGGCHHTSAGLGAETLVAGIQ